MRARPDRRQAVLLKVSSGWKGTVKGHPEGRFRRKLSIKGNGILRFEAALRNSLADSEWHLSGAVQVDQITKLSSAERDYLNSRYAEEGARARAFAD